MRAGAGWRTTSDEAIETGRGHQNQTLGGGDAHYVIWPLKADITRNSSVKLFQERELKAHHSVQYSEAQVVS